MARTTKKENPQFFCDHCGAEVGLDEKRCPSCGRSFASVRCPKCDFTGDEGLFRNGCPHCGYSAKFDESLISPPSQFETGETFQNIGSLPLWVYLVTIAAFITAALFLCNLFR